MHTICIAYYIHFIIYTNIIKYSHILEIWLYVLLEFIWDKIRDLMRDLIRDLIRDLLRDLMRDIMGALMIYLMRDLKWKKHL